MTLQMREYHATIVDLICGDGLTRDFVQEGLLPDNILAPVDFDGENEHCAHYPPPRSDKNGKLLAPWRAGASLRVVSHHPQSGRDWLWPSSTSMRTLVEVKAMRLNVSNPHTPVDGAGGCEG